MPFNMGKLIKNIFKDYFYCFDDALKTVCAKKEMVAQCRV